ncbi:MAG: acetylornithine deacetylase [Pseudonocardiales bacterium]|nr:acetylornithine deacetylase [Pseudonocardiales bacterium]
MPPLLAGRPQAVAHYRQLVRIPTISRVDESTTDWAPFAKVIELLPRLFPVMHTTLSREIHAGYSMMYHWKGRRPGAVTVLMAHYDVVSATDDGWTHPPFDATLVGDDETGTIWGRGSIDDKASMAGILAAVERLSAEGFVPEHDIYLAFSHNEEVLGDGTPTMVEWFRTKGIAPALVLDEGGIVGESIFPGVSRPHIFVGVGEKGTLTLELSARAKGGHASVPPPVTSTARLAKALVRVTEAPFLPELNAETAELVRLLGPHSAGPMREASTLLGSNPRKAARVFATISDEASAMTRTTPVVTSLSGSHAVNALPELATAAVNTRIAVGSTAQAVTQAIIAAIDDPQINHRIVESFDPPAASPSGGRAWDLVCDAITATYGDTLIAPYINNGGTDSRNYAVISDFVYRFNPYDMTLDERRAIHAIDERLPLPSFLRGCDFYLHLIKNL